jgi:lysophospholipase L1-like esterase
MTAELFRPLWLAASVTVIVAAAALAATVGVSAAPSQPAVRCSASASAPVDAWTSSPTAMASPYTDKTVRDIVHTSIGGGSVQLRLSNAFGTVPVTFDAVWVGEQATGAGIVAGSNRQVRFGGSTSVTVPVGSEALSDPVDMTATAGDNLSVSIHVAGDTGEVTGHWEAEQDGWYSSGDTASDPSPTTYVNHVQWWFWLDAVLVHPRRAANTIVALGDSITEGYHSTTSANRRYPDDLAARLAPMGCYGVANEGIGGNRVTADAGIAGVSALARLDRDVLSQPNVSTVIYMEGINDIGNGIVTSAGQLIQADQQIIARLHAEDIRVVGGTLTPMLGSGYYTAAREAIRQQVNNWVRTSNAFDGVVDFDAVTRDPANPAQLLPAYDSGDHLHPNDAGYQAMAAAVPIDSLTSRR